MTKVEHPISIYGLLCSQISYFIHNICNNSPSGSYDALNLKYPVSVVVSVTRPYPQKLKNASSVSAVISAKLKLTKGPVPVKIEVRTCPLRLSISQDYSAAGVECYMAHCRPATCYVLN